MKGFNIKVFPTIKDKQNALHWFLKWKNKLSGKKLPPKDFDCLMIIENEAYKKWDFRKPFRGKNPKYKALLLKESDFEIKPFRNIIPNLTNNHLGTQNI